MKVFNNSIAKSVSEKARRKANQYRKRFGDDAQKHYPLKGVKHPQLGGHLDLWDLMISRSDEGAGQDLPDDKSVIIGNIRMGFGHYRIAIAMASAARALGYRPYWFDLHSYEETTGGKIIAHLNKLYSMGSRWSQQSKLFNHLLWEPISAKGFKKLSYHITDWYTTQLMTPIFKGLDKAVPFVGTHVWPAQAAVHAGMKSVVNAIPDNWPMGLHLAPGSIHTVQTPSSYFGYRHLRGMAGQSILEPMQGLDVHLTGHYVDAELLEGLGEANMKRRLRLAGGGPLRILLTVGGAGAQLPMFKSLMAVLVPFIKAKKVVLMVNLGDHLGLWQPLKDDLEALNRDLLTEHFDQWESTQQWIENLATSDREQGIHVFYHKDVFAAVYTTNLLMPQVDLMLTKPSELAFYPVPKLMLPRVGGHEAWGAIRAAELGDGTPECFSAEEACVLLKRMIEDPKQIGFMVDAIEMQNRIGTYDGAYKVIQLAVGKDPVGRM